jgi:hypothetical protein
MRVKVALFGLDIDVQKPDAESLLLLFQSAAYNTTVFSTTCLFNIKEEALTFGGKGYNINGPLFHGRSVGVTALRKQPVYSYNLTSLTFNIPVIGFFHKKSF